jgi:hypothetical protein
LQGLDHGGKSWVKIIAGMPSLQNWERLRKQLTWHLIWESSAWRWKRRDACPLGIEQYSRVSVLDVVLWLQYKHMCSADQAAYGLVNLSAKCNVNETMYWEYELAAPIAGIVWASLPRSLSNKAIAQVQKNKKEKRTFHVMKSSYTYQNGMTLFMQQIWPQKTS